MGKRGPKPDGMTTVWARVSTDTRAEIVRLAQQEERTISKITRRLVEEALAARKAREQEAPNG